MYNGEKKIGNIAFFSQTTINLKHQSGEKIKPFQLHKKKKKIKPLFKKVCWKDNKILPEKNKIISVSFKPVFSWHVNLHTNQYKQLHYYPENRNQLHEKTNITVSLKTKWFEYLKMWPVKFIHRFILLNFIFTRIQTLSLYLSWFLFNLVCTWKKIYCCWLLIYIFSKELLKTIPNPHHSILRITSYLRNLHVFLFALKNYIEFLFIFIWNIDTRPFVDKENRALNPSKITNTISSSQ